MPDLNALVDELFRRPDDEGVTLALVVQHRGDVVAERYGVQPENIFPKLGTVFRSRTGGELQARPLRSLSVFPGAYCSQS